MWSSHCACRHACPQVQWFVSGEMRLENKLFTLFNLFCFSNHGGKLMLFRWNSCGYARILNERHCQSLLPVILKKPFCRLCFSAIISPPAPLRHLISRRAPHIAEMPQQTETQGKHRRDLPSQQKSSPSVSPHRQTTLHRHIAALHNRLTREIKRTVLLQGWHGLAPWPTSCPASMDCRSAVLSDHMLTWEWFWWVGVWWCWWAGSIFEKESLSF